MSPYVPPVLLFDVMDTLVVDPFYVQIPAFFGITREELLAQKHPTAWHEFERGELTAGAYYSKMFADRRTFDGAALERHLSRHYRWVEGIEPLLLELAEAGVEMHAFSNYPVWYQLVERELGLSRLVPWTFVSCRTGLRKPDPEAYRSAARHLGRPPSECLFVDDRAKNCDAARSVGMDAVVFEHAPALRRELEARAILK